MGLFSCLFKPFTDLSDFVHETDERNAREDALKRRREEINRINAKYRWEDYNKPAAQAGTVAQEERGNG